MNSMHQFNVMWMRTGAVCGLLGIIAYLLAAFAPLPDSLGYFAAFSFGPLLAIGLTGLYYGLSSERSSPLLQIAAGLGIAAGTTVLLMLTTQQAIFGVVKSAIGHAGDSAVADTYRKMSSLLNAVHFGMDIAWDVLISASVVLFGIGMLRHPKFGRVLGAVGMLLGCLLLVTNIWYFPEPPVSVNGIDWGPFVALWLLTSFIFLLRAGFSSPKR